MLINPFIYDKFIRRSTIFLSIAAGFSYAFVCGVAAGLIPGIILLDGAVSSLLIYAVCALLWNIHRYSLPISSDTYQSLVLNIFYCIISIVFITGIEMLTVYFVFGSFLGKFAVTIPVRALCIILFYCVLHLFLTNGIKNDAEFDETADAEDSNSSSGNPTEKTGAGIVKASDERQALKRITVKTGQRIQILQVDEILYIKAEDDYVSFVTKEGKWLKMGTLKEYDAILPDDRFARIHRSYIVNLGEINKIERFGQKKLLRLNDGTIIRISDSGYKTLCQKLRL
ncbi:MAG: LytTR family transcriptional regulator [Bacteroidales bacterium]|jgi:hypothetical protein|nr:LytTR family transcriptional regulator [Bacteroidales bacterium]